MAEQYNSNFTGPEIDAILGGAVRYDLAQSLTAAQQKQARENIGADSLQGAVRYDQVQSLTEAQRALALSNIDAISRTAELCTDCNTTVKAGIYRINGSTKNGPSYITAGLGHLLIVLPWDQNTLVQIYYAPERALKFCRFSASGWKPWECVNPRLNLGGEYRTTERYLGKPVYVKLINLGKLPNNAEISVQDTTIGRIAHIVDFRGEFTNSSGTPFLFPYGPSYASSGKYAASITVVSQNSAGTGIEIRVHTTTNFSTFPATALVKYTKSTD